MFTIRNVAPADYEMVKVLEDSLFKIHKQARPDYFHAQVQYTKQEFEDLLALPSPISLAAVCDGQIAVIEDLFTLPEYRRKGIASSLIEKARELAIAQNAEALELCVWDFNTSALHLYKKLGIQIQYCRMEERLFPG